MAITLHPSVNYQNVFSDTVKFCGIHGDAEGTSVRSTSPYTADQIKRRIVQHDIEIVGLICTIADHPFRSHFITEEPTLLNHGDLIPAYMGIHAGVFIDGDMEKPGRLAQSLAHLERSRRRILSQPINFSIDNEEEEFLYFIQNSRIFLVSNRQAIVTVPTIPIPDDTDDTPELNTPRSYHNALVAKTIGGLQMIGTDQNHRIIWANYWKDAENMIIGKAVSIPEPERLERISE